MVVPDLRDAKGIADVAVLAMPPAYVGPELLSAQECAVADVYTDVASVKVLPVAQARALGCDLELRALRIRWRAGSGRGPPPRRPTCSSAGPGRCARCRRRRPTRWRR